VLEAVIPDTTSKFAAEGTAAHELAALALASTNDAMAYLGRVIQADGMDFTVDKDMAEHVQVYLDYVRGIQNPTSILFEQRMPLAPFTGEADAYGTADAVVVTDDELVVVDLKYGAGVSVDAEGNEQLTLYAAAALEEFGFLADIQRVRMVIVQPRKGNVSEWTVPVAELADAMGSISFAAKEAIAAAQQHTSVGRSITTEAWQEAWLNPGEKQCRFCRAKATCPALAQAVSTELVMGAPASPDEFAVLEPRTDTPEDKLARAMAAVGMIEDWCKAVRAEVERRLLGGEAVAGYKLVRGKQGNRKWTDETEATEAMKSMRLKVEQMYDLKLISPTTAEKLAKAGTLGPRQWASLQDLVTRAEGSPSVAPESDKRPAIQLTTAEDFEVLA
jgi:hypothetical protein